MIVLSNRRRRGKDGFCGRVNHNNVFVEIEDDYTGRSRIDEPLKKIVLLLLFHAFIAEPNNHAVVDVNQVVKINLPVLLNVAVKSRALIASTPADRRFSGRRKER